MFNDCCGELKRWSKSFTKTELLLALLEGILLVLILGFIVFLILHFVVCASAPNIIYESEDYYESLVQYDVPPSSVSSPAAETLSAGAGAAECTWDPSRKTTAATHHYVEEPTARGTVAPTHLLVTQPGAMDEEGPQLDDSEDEAAEEGHADHVLALVKIKPPQDITFGCMLTAISEYWVITAASCIESIEEVDSLDSFVMMEGRGGGRAHAVVDVLLHPLYHGVNRSYDLAALRSERRLPRPIPLHTLLEYFTITIGERLTILGFGGFRSISAGVSGRRLRAAHVYTVPSRQCSAGGGGVEWSLRHLSPGAPLAHAPCAAGPLCAGVLYARGAPCNYCAGAPLLRGERLLGLMSDTQQCGVSCEPALYVNLAAQQAWLDAVRGDC